jgi:hypothetical protein
MSTEEKLVKLSEKLTEQINENIQSCLDFRESTGSSSMDDYYNGRHVGYVWALNAVNTQSESLKFNHDIEYGLNEEIERRGSVSLAEFKTR